MADLRVRLALKHWYKVHSFAVLLTKQVCTVVPKHVLCTGPECKQHLPVEIEQESQVPSQMLLNPHFKKQKVRAEINVNNMLNFI